MFAIVQSAGSKKGLVRSVHRSFNAALKAQPATFFKLVPADDRAKKGTIRPDLLNNPVWDAKWRAA
jgi:hypothetical protein